MQLTENELRCLCCIYDAADDNSYCIEDVNAKAISLGIDIASLHATMSSLQSKRCIDTFDGCYYDGEILQDGLTYLQNNSLRVIKVVHDTIVDGEGIRTSIYFAGCLHHCAGCHNAQTWPLRSGRQMPICDIIAETNSAARITLTGGDPMLQAGQAMLKLLSELHRQCFSIWCYTGYSYEDCIADAQKFAVLQYADVLVDGKFEASNAVPNLMFRGSANQRIIDVQKSIAAKSVMLYTLNTEPNFDE